MSNKIKHTFLPFYIKEQIFAKLYKDYLKKSLYFGEFIKIIDPIVSDPAFFFFLEEQNQSVPDSTVDKNLLNKSNNDLTRKVVFDSSHYYIPCNKRDFFTTKNISEENSKKLYHYNNAQPSEKEIKEFSSQLSEFMGNDKILLDKYIDAQSRNIISKLTWRLMQYIRLGINDAVSISSKTQNYSINADFYEDGGVAIDATNIGFTHKTILDIYDKLGSERVLFIVPNKINSQLLTDYSDSSNNKNYCIRSISNNESLCEDNIGSLFYSPQYPKTFFRKEKSVKKELNDTSPITDCIVGYAISRDSLTMTYDLDYEKQETILTKHKHNFIFDSSKIDVSDNKLMKNKQNKPILPIMLNIDIDERYSEGRFSYDLFVSTRFCIARSKRGGILKIIFNKNLVYD